MVYLNKILTENAIFVLWKGCFNVLDDTKHFKGSTKSALACQRKQKPSCEVFILCVRLKCEDSKTG